MLIKFCTSAADALAKIFFVRNRSCVISITYKNFANKSKVFINKLQKVKIEIRDENGFLDGWMEQTN